MQQLGYSRSFFLAPSRGASKQVPFDGIEYSKSHEIQAIDPRRCYSAIYAGEDEY
jgi:hypothetical protein